jgi:hypothetical protein
MNELIYNTLEKISGNPDVIYAILDDHSNKVFILVSPEQKSVLKNLMKDLGWKYLKNNYRNDVFLYGMDRFKDFVYKNSIITAYFQLACKSTMHKEWIPLDRKINNYALKNRMFGQDNVYWLENKYDIVYRIAKCIFTEGQFSASDKEKIQNSEYLLNDEKAIGFLESIFFKFTQTLLDMLLKRDYDRIISTYFKFSEY